MSNTAAVLPNGPPVFLAPMAGITDLPFRNLVARFGAGLVVSEMIASQEVVQAKPDARAKAELGFGAQNCAIQLAGREPYWMAEAARFAEDQGAKIIDINMGCPAKKVVSGYSGSALLRDLDLAGRLIDAVVSSASVPVTLKTRLGWDEKCRASVELARRAETLGVQMITIHGRTRCQFYKGKTDWAAIRDVKDAVSIPVVANGDIVSAACAQKALELSGADAVMIGRGAQGRPWLLAEVAHALFGTPKPDIPTGSDLAEMIAEHHDAMLSFYGTDLGIRNARKHLNWYLDRFETSDTLRRLVLTTKDPNVVGTAFQNLGIRFVSSDPAKAA